MTPEQQRVSGVRVNIPALYRKAHNDIVRNPAARKWIASASNEEVLALVEAVEAAQDIDLLYLLHDKAEPDSKAHAAFKRLMAALEPFDSEFDKAVT